MKPEQKDSVLRRWLEYVEEAPKGSFERALRQAKMQAAMRKAGGGPR